MNKLSKTLSLLALLSVSLSAEVNFTKAFKPGLKKVFYHASNASDSSLYVGGSRSWRNHNSGNLVYSDFSIRHGAIGTDGVFAIFPTKESGKDALSALLHGDSYIELTLKDAMLKYAPQHENDTKKYIAFLEKKTGITWDFELMYVGDDDFDKLVDAIPLYEGFKEGVIVKNSDFSKYEKAIKKK